MLANICSNTSIKENLASSYVTRSDWPLWALHAEVFYRRAARAYDLFQTHALRYEKLVSYQNN